MPGLLPGNSPDHRDRGDKPGEDARWF